MWDVNWRVKITCCILAIVSNLLMTSCNKGEAPVLSELKIDSITHNSIHCHVDVINGNIDDHAFYYATTKNNAENSNAISEKGFHNEKTLEATIKGLESNTTYYLRAYAINNYGRTYTTTISTRTLPRVPTIEDNNYPSIDK